MTSSINGLKSIVERVPFGIGRHLSRVPFSVRLGSAYNANRRLINEFENLSWSDKEAWVVEKLTCDLQKARDVSSFYHDRLQSVSTSDGHAFWDAWRTIPPVSKAELRAIEPQHWGRRAGAVVAANTGGTSGEPLSFFHPRHAFAKEWAHMHWIWEMLGYRTDHVKLTFRGKNLGSEALRYNPVHNEFLVNTYAPFQSQCDAIAGVAKHVSFIHGYPSSIAEFARKLTRHRPQLADQLRSRLRGILFASEYPAPIFRESITETFTVPSISWYGHSEFCVLAYEVEPYVYKPMHTYGFAEAIEQSGSESEAELLGTSYDNLVSPFIRYRTGDTINANFRGNLIESFTVNEGRVGEYVVDSNGDRVSLTALIFGRHHPIFKVAHFVQVRQRCPGELTLMVTLPTDSEISQSDLERGFDLSGLQFKTKVERWTEPQRTKRGKVPLKIE